MTSSERWGQSIFELKNACFQVYEKKKKVQVVDKYKGSILLCFASHHGLAWQLSIFAVFDNLSLWVKSKKVATFTFHARAKLQLLILTLTCRANHRLNTKDKFVENIMTQQKLLEGPLVPWCGYELACMSEGWFEKLPLMHTTPAFFRLLQYPFPHLLRSHSAIEASFPTHRTLDNHTFWVHPDIVATRAPSNPSWRQTTLASFKSQ